MKKSWKKIQKEYCDRCIYDDEDAIEICNAELTNIRDKMKCCGNCKYELRTEDEHIKNCLPCKSFSNWELKNGNP